MKIFIKNMVCARCIRTVERLFAETGLPTQNVQLGEVETAAEPTAEQLFLLKNKLETEGFDLLDDRASRLVEQVKTLVVNEIHHEPKKPEAMNFSDFLARETRHDYSNLSRLFSSVEGITIEKFVIAQKIERVKELLIYDEMSLGEIAFQTGYSSTQHLSNQFKQVVGMTPTAFKTNHHTHGRKPLDGV